MELRGVSSDLWNTASILLATMPLSDISSSAPLLRSSLFRRSWLTPWWRPPSGFKPRIAWGGSRTKAPGRRTWSVSSNETTVEKLYSTRDLYWMFLVGMLQVMNMGLADMLPISKSLILTKALM